MPELTSEDISGLIRGYFKDAVSQSIELAYILPRDHLYDQAGEIGSLKQRMLELEALLAHRSWPASVQSEAHELLGTILPEKLAPASERFQQLCQGILRADHKNARILAAMLAGKFHEVAPQDPIFVGIAVNEPPPVPGDGTTAPAEQTLASVATLFHAYKAKHDWVAKTAADANRVLALTKSIIGEKKLFKTLGIDDVKAVRDAIASLPPNYVKVAANKGFSPKDAIKANVSGPTLALKTQDKYYTMFRQLLIWGRNEGYIDKVPGEGVKLAGSAKVDAGGNRKPYSREQLQAIFASPLYQGHQSETTRHKPGPALVRDGKFWVPLIALYSGMRMGEIVQLLVTDIKTQDGIAYFDVSTSEGEDKTLKTQSSVRKVPVHKVLLDLGLLDHAHGLARMFPEIKKGEDGYYSHNFSKWWGRYTRQIKVSTKDTAFHSFRHGFKDALQAVEAPEYISKALMGHSDKDVHAGYGSGPTLSVMKKTIDKVVYGIEPVIAEIGSNG
ncbi:site-specific integrase [Mesorhizobium sp. AD1-1]|uniref:site-specific integrase n=1 Tax=Mesorhizobium sp. AD1-1 TaxID=2876621 RepID=UPI001CCEC2A1|nr:site-specific integrase [Mesorhizobium sp. AD1-1]MBZ9717048.1 site-specific integrase [Mesorhizobium sp. AD1-1]